MDLRGFPDDPAALGCDVDPVRHHAQAPTTHRLHELVVLTTALTLGHHVYHVVRGNHSGWPFQDHVSPFTFSLLVYRVVATGLSSGDAEGSDRHTGPSCGAP